VDRISRGDARQASIDWTALRSRAVVSCDRT
jgi:hypothetical protein